MQKTKLTVRVDKDLLASIKEYATTNKTTLTKLIDAYLRQIHSQNGNKHSPIVTILSGTLSKDASIEDYKKHLEEKYAQ